MEQTLFVQIIFIVLMASALLISIIGHEIMHGLVAFYYGDNTAKSMGRLSINPLKHIDPIGSIVLPIVLYATNAPFLFGWAKPVPVDLEYIINNRGYGAAIGVAIAGVSYNLALALFASLLLFSIGGLDSILLIFLTLLIQYNVILCVFNLWIIPPLDGSKVLLFTAMKYRIDALARFLIKIEPFGIVILLVILFIPQLAQILFYPAKMLILFLLPH